MEIIITNTAIEKIKNMAKEYNIEPTVRVYVESTACKGANFGIAFDEPKQFDVLTEIEGIEIVTDTAFLPKYCDGLSIDYAGSIGKQEGYIIKSINPVNVSCGGCSKSNGSSDNSTHEHGKCGGCNGCGRDSDSGNDNGNSNGNGNGNSNGNSNGNGSGNGSGSGSGSDRS
jgi:iron-sulfur cluster assembly accessory protein